MGKTLDYQVAYLTSLGMTVERRHRFILWQAIALESLATFCLLFFGMDATDNLTDLQTNRALKQYWPVYVQNSAELCFFTGNG